jgi:hypothetical protein
MSRRRADPLALYGAAFRLWTAMAETSFYAASTIAQRTVMASTSLMTQGTLPAAETTRMVAEKTQAAVASAAGMASMAARHSPGAAGAIAIAAAGLRPLHRKTRTNSRRLSRRKRPA